MNLWRFLPGRIRVWRAQRVIDRWWERNAPLAKVLPFRRKRDL